VKERPILFNAPMVRAIIEGMKRQTRRVVKPQPSCQLSESPKTDPVMGWQISGHSGIWDDDDATSRRWRCPYGQPGDRLVMLTTWATEKQYDGTKPSRLPDNARIWSLWDGDTKPEWCGRLRPGRFLPGRFRHLMPRSEIIDVRVQRVQDITEEDAKAEGVDGGGPVGHIPTCLEMGRHRYQFCHLWDSINSNRGFGWDSNPWVWAITFKRL